MSDLENLEALRRMIENKEEKEKEEETKRELKFFADAARVCLGKDASESAVREYAPEKLIPFLEKPAKEIQSLMGGEWAEMPSDKFGLFVYSIEKKVRKSTTLLDWNS